jgi:hypothetical protein
MVETEVSVGTIRPRLVAIWGVLLLLVAAIAAIELKDRTKPEIDEDSIRDPRMLLPVPVAQLGVVEIAHAGALHRFERDAAGVWFYHGVHAPAQGAHAHQPDPALAKRIDTALIAFGRTHVEREMSLERGPQEYGLSNPQMIILVYRPKDLQPLAQYAVGDIAPDTHSRYVLVVGRSAVGTIPNYQIENLLGLIKAASEQSAPNTAKSR